MAEKAAVPVAATKPAATSEKAGPVVRPKSPGKNSCETFERGVPSYWIPSRPGSLKTSALHSKHGKHSLKWNWRGGDSIKVRHGVGNIKRTGGYGGSRAKATFGLWYYVEKPVDGKAVVQFRTGDKVTGWFELPLNFTGWRRAHLRYTWRPQFKGKVSPKTDNIKIIAPKSAKAGTIFFDLIVYNGLMHWQVQHVPSYEKWTPVKPDESLFPLPKKVTEKEAASIKKIASRLNSHIVETEKGTGNLAARSLASARKIKRIFGTFVVEPVTDEVMKGIEKQVSELEIIRDADGIRGKPFAKTKLIYSEFFPKGVGYPRDITNLMKSIGQHYHRTDNPEYRKRLAKWYVDISNHIHDQGMTVGVGFNWGWYPGRALADATFMMRETLQKHGTLRRSSEYLDQNCGFSRIFDDATIKPNMDHFYMNTPNHLKCALLQATPQEQVRSMRAFSRRLSKEIMYRGGNGFKPDGSACHHGMHYFAYADYSVNNLVSIIHMLRGTPFQVTPEALAQLKKVVLAMRFYCNWRDLPLPLSGRHPFALNQRVNPETLLTLAMAGSPDGKHDVDPELAAAFLRFYPEKQKNAIFSKHNITPEKTPQGNMTMNYACLMAHRRDDWLALVKGYGRYKAYGEIYAKNNRYGRYISNGYLDILAGGNPVTQKASGCVSDGWDWNRLDGTTVIYLPRKLLVARSRGTEWIGSPEPFVGGLSHRSRNGVFVMQLHGSKRHAPTFTGGKKTYFLFDNRIICLGSNIKNADAKHETHTNLFQKHLPKTDVPVNVNGQEVRTFPAKKILSGKQTNWLIDTQRTGYYLPAGQKVRVARKHQKNRNPHDTKEMAGDFASAWIDHGKAPKDAQYEYAVLIRTTPEEMRTFSAAMAMATAAAVPQPYTVFQKDKLAHIVFDRKTRIYGCVFFKAQDVKHSIPVKKVDHSCLVMAEETPNGMHLSLADPDLNLVVKAKHRFVSQPRRIRVTLKGRWKIANPSPDFRVAATGSDDAVIEFTCRHGGSYDVELTK
ncbi:MAG: hypothetical protein K8S55_01100 [Phycisphaerae bacterium]|nr:hypothetical protein [Phycisphaerae bacterium]